MITFLNQSGAIWDFPFAKLQAYWNASFHVSDFYLLWDTDKQVRAELEVQGKEIRAQKICDYYIKDGIQTSILPFIGPEP